MHFTAFLNLLPGGSGKTGKVVIIKGPNKTSVVSSITEAISYLILGNKPCLHGPRKNGLLKKRWFLNICYNACRVSLPPQNFKIILNFSLRFFLSFPVLYYN